MKQEERQVAVLTLLHAALDAGVPMDVVQEAAQAVRELTESIEVRLEVGGRRWVIDLQAREDSSGS